MTICTPDTCAQHVGTNPNGHCHAERYTGEYSESLSCVNGWRNVFAFGKSASNCWHPDKRTVQGALL